MTLGAGEKEDLLTLIDFLHGSRQFSKIAIWARSMGAAISILAAARTTHLTGKKKENRQAESQRKQK